MTVADDGLIERAVAGDKEALGQLLRRHLPALSDRLEGTIGPAYRPALGPEEVLQITCMEAFLGIGSFKPRRPDAFFGWLLRMAQNNVRDAIRSLDREKREPRKRQVKDPYGHDSYVGLFANLSGGGKTPSGQLSAVEQVAALKAAIASLPEFYQQAITLVDLEGRSAEEAAAALGKTSGAVHMARQRARQHLARLLADSTRSLAEASVKRARS